MGKKKKKKKDYRKTNLPETIPSKADEGISRALYTHLDVEAHVLAPLVVLSVQLGDQLVGLDARVLRQCTGNRLEGLRKLLDGVLLKSRARLHRERGRKIYV